MKPVCKSRGSMVTVTQSRNGTVKSSEPEPTFTFMVQWTCERPQLEFYERDGKRYGCDVDNPHETEFQLRDDHHHDTVDSEEP